MKFLRRNILPFVILLIIYLPQQVAAADWQAKVDPTLLQAATQGETEFLILLSEQADLSGAAGLNTRAEKGAYVYEQLNAVARRTQPRVIALLEAAGVEYRAFRVVNMVWARGDYATIRILARRGDIAHVYANPQVQLQLPSDDRLVAAANLPDAPSAPGGIEWNIAKVNAPQVWAAGFTGQGTVIAGQDTGYDWDHPALKNQYRGWDGATADHDYNWHDAIHHESQGCPGDSPEPCDDYGHGTHTMGTMVGDDGAGNQIGMAPGARWIGCRNMDDYGIGSPASYTECFDWFLAPYPVGGDPSQGDPGKAPDVISNSWTCTSSEGCAYDTLAMVVNTVRAAGIVVVAAASNTGSSCSSIQDPPAIYEASFTVGATNNDDNIASFSARGPILVDGSQRPKPDISAPGVNVRSAFPGTGYSNMSGTSMATPHVAGLVSLLISAEPNLRGQVDAIEAIIQHTAVPRINLACGGEEDGVPNNIYGWGRINALAAYQCLLPHQLFLNKTVSASWIEPGNILTYTLIVTHTHPITATMNVVITDTLPGGTFFLDATQPYNLAGEVITWDFASLGANESRSVTLAVGIPLTTTGTITNQEYGVKSDEVAPPVSGPPILTWILHKAWLPLLVATP